MIVSYFLTYFCVHERIDCYWYKPIECYNGQILSISLKIVKDKGLRLSCFKYDNLC